jgi:phospholipid/cholesterol/gamma-HCH transport system permease protein
MQTHRSYIEAWNLRADRVGGSSLRLLHDVHQFYTFVMSILGFGLRLKWISRPAVVNVLIRQIYFTGVEGLPWVILIALFAGVTAMYQMVLFAKSVEDISLIGTLTSSLLVQEIAPLLVSVFLLARSGVAVVTEIGDMHIRGEDALLHSLGISLAEYLYLPRMLAFALCGLILTILFAGISIWISGLLVAWNHEMNLIQFLVEIRKGTDISEVLIMIGKALLLPLLCCSMLTFQASKVGDNPNHIPIRATYGVLGSLLMIVVIDVLIALIGSLA